MSRFEVLNGSMAMEGVRIVKSAAVVTLRELRSRGIELELKDGELRYRAPRGALTHADVARLRREREALRQLLREEPGAAMSAEQSRRHGEPTLLNYSQLTHWHRYQLKHRAHLRQIASATRLRGRLDLTALERALTEMVARHEALRTSMVVLAGVPYQVINRTGSLRLHIEDLTHIDHPRQPTAVLEAIRRAVLEPVRVTQAPLASVRLLVLNKLEHVLVVTMEHLISDGYSRSILLRELFAAYEMHAGGVPARLPEIRVQLAAHAHWQRGLEPHQIESLAAYWNERLAGYQRLPFPQGTATDTTPGWQSVPVHITGETKRRLGEWARRNRTTLALCVMTAYSIAALRWCDSTHCVVRYEIDGRDRPELANTIGYFASGLHLRVEIAPEDTFEDIARRVMQEYCDAYANADHAWLTSEMPVREITRTIAFNWQSDEVAQPPAVDSPGAHSAIAREPMSFEHPMMRQLEWDADPALALFESPEAIAGTLYFPSNRFRTEQMHSFVGTLHACIETMAHATGVRVSEVELSGRE